MTEKYKAKAKLSEGFTINMGNYESARIDVGIEVEGDRENLPELWEKAVGEVEEKLGEQVGLLRESMDDRKTILGDEKGPKFN